MADKINVTAKEDFYDKANARPRTKGEKFVVRKGTEKQLGGKVEVGDVIKDQKPKAEKQQATPQTKGKKVEAVEKVKQAPKKKEASENAAAEEEGPKDITMDNIKEESEEAKEQ